MSTRTPQSSFSSRLSSLGVALVPLLVTVGIHAALFYAFRLKSSPVLPKRLEEESSCVLLPGPEERPLAPWERDLYQWAALANPALLVLPDEELGFSHVLTRPGDLPMTPFPSYKVASVGVREGPMPPIAFAEDTPGLDSQILRFWEPAELPIPPPAPVQELPRGVFWRYPDGRLLTSPPEMDDDALARALAEGALPKYPTVVDVDRETFPSWARVVVQRGCGNAMLDQLVVDSLRHALTARLLGGQTTDPGKEVDYIPDEGARVRLEVEWTLLPKKVVVD